MRKHAAVIAALALISLAPAGLLASEEAKEEKKKDEKVVRKYVGVKQCLMCHEEMDDAPSTWKASKHSKAYEALGSEEAKKHSDEPKKDSVCLQCHVTGPGKPGGFSPDLDEKKRSQLENVTCESCHGPAQEYSKIFIMSKAEGAAPDRKKLAEAGLILKPGKEKCAECHNDKSPTFEKFDFEKMLEKIKHGKKLEKKE
ncbi:MAG: cytochrome c family protein [bacterium]